MNTIVGAFGGGGGAPPAPVEADDTLSSKQTLKLLILLGEGEFDSIGDIIINGVDISNYDASWDWRPGTATQTPIAGFVDTEQPIATHTPVELAPLSDYFVSVPYDAAACRITLNLALLKQILSNGNTVGYEVNFDLSTRPSSSALWTQIATITKEGKASSQYAWDTKVPRPEGTTIASSWEIRLTRTTSPDTSKQFSQTIWQFATAIYESNLNYAYSALLALTFFDAKQFGGRIPEISVRPKGVKVKIPSNYDPINHLYDESTPWDGTLTESLFHYTANVPWHIYNVLNNSRYALGLDKPDIDVISFYSLSKYGDELVDDGKGGVERRFEINNQFLTRENSPTFLVYLLSLCNANFTRNEFGQLSIMYDHPGQAVTKQVANQNIIGGKFIYSSSDIENRYNLVNVTYSREEFQGGTDTATDTEDSLVSRYGLQTSDVFLPGCTSEGMAVRKARWSIYNTSFLPNLVSYKLLFAGLTYRVGELVRAFDSNNQGSAQTAVIIGSSQSSGNTTIQLDRELTLSDDAFTVYFMNEDGKTEEGFAVLESNGDFSSVSFVGLTTPIINGVILLSGAIIPRIYKVIKITRDEDEHTIIAVEHNEAKYTYIDDITALPAPSGDFVNVSEFLTAAVSNITVVENFPSNGVNTNSFLEVYWDWDKGAASFEADFLLTWKRDSQESTFVSDIAGKTHSILNPVPGLYEITVWAVSPFSGIKSAPTIQTYNFRTASTDSSLQPPINVFVVGTSGLVFNTQDLNLTFDYDVANINVTDALLDYVVEVWDSTTTNLKGTYTVNPNQQLGGSFTLSLAENIDRFGSATRTFNLKVFSRDVIGDLSLPAIVQVTNPVPATASFSVSSGLSQSFINILSSSETDLIGYLIYRDTVSGFTPGVSNLVYDGPDTYVGLAGDSGVTYYFRVAAYDTFSKTSLNISGEQSSTTLSTEVDVWLFDGLIFKPDDPATNSVSWTAGSASKNGAASIAIASGNATWSSGILYVYYDGSSGTLTATTDILQVVGGVQALATYKGGTALIVGNGSAFTDGGLILANTVGANQLVSDSAIITNALQVANAIIDSIHVKDGAITNLKIGDVIQSPDFSEVNKTGWHIDKIGNIKSYGSFELYDQSGNPIIVAGANAAVEWAAVQGVGVPEDNATIGADFDTNLVNIPYETIINNDDATALGFNPTFSAWAGVAPDNWVSWNGDPIKETSIVNTGNFSVKLVATGLNGGPGITKLHDFAGAPLALGTFLSGSIDLYLETVVSGLPGMLIRLYKDPGLDTYRDVKIQPTSSVTGQWAKLPWVAKQAEGELIYGFSIYFMGSWVSLPTGPFTGTCYFDNLNFILLDASLDNESITVDADGKLIGAGGGQVTIAGLGYTGDLDADVTATNTSNNTINVGSSTASEVSTATINFNNNNDRLAAPVVNPTVISDGTAIDHVLNSDGSMDLTFEWLWAGNDNEIDGFIIYSYSNDASASYNFGSNPTKEAASYIPSGIRAFGFLGLASDRFYTFGIQAYRVVDTDINSSGILKSNLVQPGLAAEDPYQGEVNSAFSGDLTGTINGAPIGDLATQDTADFETQLSNIPAETIYNNDDSTAYGFNPTFSAWSGTYPDNWELFASSNAISKESTIVNIGDFSVKCVGNGLDNVGIKNVVSSSGFPLPFGVVLSGSVDIYLETVVSGLPGILVRLFTQADLTVFTDSEIQPQISTTGEWIKVPWVAKVPADKQIFGIQINLMGSWSSFATGQFNGVCYFDNLNFALFSPSFDNETISVDADGSLLGAGGGQVTITGLGYSGELDANNTTNTNQLVDGASLGDTALWVSVSGAGKPDDNADVTSNNTALNTSNVGDLAASEIQSASNSFWFSGFEPEEFAGWIIESGHNAAAETSDVYSGTQSVKITTTTVDTDASGVAGGFYFEIPERVAVYFGDKRIRVSFYAKTNDGCSKFSAAYSTAEVGNSGWIEFTPTASWALYTFSYFVTAPVVAGLDYIGIQGFTDGTILIDNIAIAVDAEWAEINGAPDDGTILNNQIAIDSAGNLLNAGGGQVTIAGLGYSGDLDADVTANNTSDNTTNVGSSTASEVSAVTINFNNKNDRLATPINDPTILTDGTSLDHVINDNGSVDLTFEWVWSGNIEEIDGFIVYSRFSDSASAYVFGANPVSEAAVYVPADRRSWAFFGLSANKYYTFGVQAYRSVDTDINSKGILKSGLIQPGLSSENPYQAAANLAFVGDFSGTLEGSAIGDLATQDTADFETQLSNIPAETIYNNDDSTAYGFNPTFSAWSGTYPDNWSLSSSSSAISKESSIVNIGDFSVKCAGNGLDNVGIKNVVSSSGFPLPLGVVLSGSVDIYLETVVSGLPGILVRLFTQADLTVFTDSEIQPEISTTGEWIKVPWVAKVPAAKQIFGIQINLMGSWSSLPTGHFNGICYFDNLNFALFSPSFDNETISVDADGSLLGAGGGQVTITGLGYTGDLDANKAPTTYAQNAVPSGNLIVGDLWIQTNNNNKLSRYDGASFVLLQDQDIVTALNDSAGAQSTADGKITVFYQDNAPGGDLGDLWIDTGNGNKLLRNNGTVYQLVQDADIATALTNATSAQSAADSAQATADGKIVTYYTTTTPSNPDVGDLWYSPATQLLKRWNGSAWDDAGNIVTDTNELTDGAGLGDTALWTGVAGVDKPDDNATVGSTIGTDLSGTFDTANIAVYMPGAAIGDLQFDRASGNKIVIGSADIALLAVKEGHIDDLSIDTLQIKGNAVTVTVSASSNVGEVQVAVDTPGVPLIIFANVVVSGNPPAATNVKLYGGASGLTIIKDYGDLTGFRLQGLSQQHKSISVHWPYTPTAAVETIRFDCGLSYPPVNITVLSTKK